MNPLLNNPGEYRIKRHVYKQKRLPGKTDEPQLSSIMLNLKRGLKR